MEHTVAIVGLGNIGLRYDRHLPADCHVLTHARAFALHPEFRLVAAADPDPALREEFSALHGVPAHASIEELLDQVRPDVMVVASPTGTHADIVANTLARYTPRAILCEKPLAYGMDAAQVMVTGCEAAKVPLYVNFIRRADPGVLEVKARIGDGRIAMPFKAVVWYSKGLLHNGSHFADLLSFWFGPIRAVSVVARGRAFGEGDAEPDIRLDFDHGSTIFFAAREENYSHYTVEVVAANGRLRYEQGGKIFWQEVAPHSTLPGYRRLDDTAERIENDMDRHQYRVAEQLSLALRGSDHALCTGAWSVMTQGWLIKAIEAQASGD